MTERIVPKLASLVAEWRLTDVQPVAETPRAWLFRVRTDTAQSAALKIIKPTGLESEGRQSDLLRCWAGGGAVSCLASDGANYLMEWLDGPSLGDIARGGDDMASAEILAEVAKSLHCDERPDFVPDLRRYTQALVDIRPADVPHGSHALFAKANSVLARLLADAPDPTLLHGDLHHDNIAESPRGWLAYDPKGVWGDPHFEFANSFRNPIGMFDQITNPKRAHDMAAIFAAQSGLDKTRLLQWAGVKSALSACWSLQDPVFPPEHLPIMRTMLSICE